MRVTKEFHVSLQSSDVPVSTISFILYFFDDCLFRNLDLSSPAVNLVREFSDSKLSSNTTKLFSNQLR